MNKKHLYILCGLLVLVGVSMTAYRWLALDFPLTPTAGMPRWCAGLKSTMKIPGGRSTRRPSNSVFRPGIFPGGAARCR